MKHQRLIRAGGFVSMAHAECIEVMKLMSKELDADDYAALLAQLYSIEMHSKMARELVTDSMKQALLEETNRP